MASKLDCALGAVEYVRNSPYTWSTVYQLVRRPFTLDLWDFQSDFDSALVGGDHMNADPARSQYGIFYGDNLCLAQACQHLAIMLEHCQRTDEAKHIRSFAEGLIARVDALCWNGNFYRMHVPEDPHFERPFGIDASRVMSLSNSIVANFIAHDKAVAIIRSYQALRGALPPGCRAEFLTMYPPFPRGFHTIPWEYVNGALSGLVAGELARASFAHGLPQYGSDLLRRYWELVKPIAPDIEGGIFGCMQPPERVIEPVDLSQVVNADLVCNDTRNGWFAERDNDLRSLPTGRQIFEHIPFFILDPQQHGHRACLRLGRDYAGFAEQAHIAVNAMARCLYFLHGAGGSGQVVGEMEVHYADGSQAHQYVLRDRQVMGTWNPPDLRSVPAGGIPELVSGWVGPTGIFSRIGLSLWSWSNPYPERKISHLVLKAARTPSKWGIVAVSYSPDPAWLPPREFSEGPNKYWSASMIAAALGEGLAGVQDRATNLRTVRIAPAWLAAAVDQAQVCIAYADGGGYVRYRYRHLAQEQQLELWLATNARDRQLDLLLPKDATAVQVSINDEAVEHELITLEEARYARVSHQPSHAGAIKVAVQW